MTDVQPVSRVTPPPVQRPGRPRTRTKRRPIGLTPRIKTVLDRMAYEGMTRPEAAQAVGITDNAVRIAFRNPVVLKYWNECQDVLRTSEGPRSIRKIAGLRDNAASERVQLEAAKHLDTTYRPGNGGVTVNVGVNVQPGYMVDVTGHQQASTQILHQAGSTRNLLTEQQDVPDEG